MTSSIRRSLHSPRSDGLLTGRCSGRLGRSTTLRSAQDGTHLHGQKPSHCVDHDYHHCRSDLNDFAINLARPAQRDLSGYEPGSWTRLARGGGLVLLGAGFYRSASDRGNHRAAASALSSGRVLKAIAAPGAALWTALMTASNNARRRGGRRTPAPITTQS
jgi:hypothetical protein